MSTTTLTFCDWTGVSRNVEGAAHTNYASDATSDHIAAQSQELRKVGERTERDIGDASRGLIPDDLQRDVHARPVRERQVRMSSSRDFYIEIRMAFIYIAQPIPRKECG